VELVELTVLGDADWAQLRDGEQEPFGAIGEALHWSAKDHYMALRGDDGRLLAAAGVAVFEVEVEGTGAFEVVGLGGVIVTHTMRGRGLFSRVVGPALAKAAQLGPERMMLFCRPELVARYARLGFRVIDAPVWADQPGGHIEMPHEAMWLALREGAEWPAGRVDVRGLPF
jgi:predicted N-acetyltransferase YhbS